MTSATKDTYTIHGLLYTIDGVQRHTTQSLWYLQQKVGMTYDEGVTYLRMLRAEELRKYSRPVKQRCAVTVDGDCLTVKVGRM